jgi:hypothetical protein
MGQWMTTNKVLFDNLFVLVGMLYIFDECSSMLIITTPIIMAMVLLKAGFFGILAVKYLKKKIVLIYLNTHKQFLNS